MLRIRGRVCKLGFVAFVAGAASRCSDRRENPAHQLFQAAFAGFVFDFSLSDRLFPCLGKSRGLLAHETDGVLDDGQLSKFGPTGLMLESGKVDAQVLILSAEIFEPFLQAVIALGVDLELDVEVLLEFFAVLLYPFHFALQISLGSKP